MLDYLIRVVFEWRVVMFTGQLNEVLGDYLVIFLVAVWVIRGSRGKLYGFLSISIYYILSLMYIYVQMYLIFYLLPYWLDTGSLHLQDQDLLLTDVGVYLLEKFALNVMYVINSFIAPSKSNQSFGGPSAIFLNRNIHQMSFSSYMHAKSLIS